MGFLDFIFGKKVKRQDDFFGEMIFLENRKQSEKNYFDCHRPFAPISKDIQLCVSGDLTESLERQQVFFKKIEENYSLLCARFAPIAEQEIRNWQPNFQVLNFEKEFVPDYLTLPRCDQSPVVWEISFKWLQDFDHNFNFTLRDFQPHELMIDG